ncbi:hypothetical protein [Romboutsia sp.]|uniref:hypothetical protein n=1 Tax=Romboutsia sp. TaxID=1965302 RepID=UPI003F32979B
MGRCKDEMKKLINGEVEEVHIISEMELLEGVATSVQVWNYDKESDVLSYCTLTKSNTNRPYFIKIKNGEEFVDKKYIGESLTDDAKLTLTTKEKALELLEKLKVNSLL